ncbi:MAG TPA: potassium-transporting ATPase subunit C [Thermoplasmata archaeon]|nr:potassium-transporting ATPase subunit C [Thermoplasmata archaeon]
MSAAATETSAAAPPPPRKSEPEVSGRVPPAHSWSTHVRATVLLLVLSILLTGFVYPVVTTEVAQVIDPYAANGSLLYFPNGTVAGSALVAQNTDAPYLFWERPSLTDYNTTLGTSTPPGPSDPALVNETLSYMAQYGYYTVNASVPFWLVSASGSSVDPDLTPEAVLVQVPRVALNTNLTEANLTALVNAHIVNPDLPFVGVAYVDVLELDLALLPLIGR